MEFSKSLYLSKKKDASVRVDGNWHLVCVVNKILSAFLITESIKVFMSRFAQDRYHLDTQEGYLEILFRWTYLWLHLQVQDEGRTRVINNLTPSTAQSALQRIIPFPCKKQYTVVILMPQSSHLKKLKSFISSRDAKVSQCFYSSKFVFPCLHYHFHRPLI